MRRNLLLVIAIIASLLSGSLSYTPALAGDVCAGIIVKDGFHCVPGKNGAYSVEPNATTTPSSTEEANQPEGRAVANGTTLKAGTLVVTEIVSRGDKEVSVFGGPLESDFVVSQDHNAWTPYNSVQDAHQGACSEADARWKSKDFKGYTISVNEQSFTGTCPLKDVTAAQAASTTVANADNTTPVATAGAYDPNTKVSDSDIQTQATSAATYQWIGGDILGDGDCYIAISEENGQLPHASDNAGVYVQGNFVATSHDDYNRQLKAVQDAEARDSRTHTCPVINQASGS